MTPESRVDMHVKVLDERVAALAKRRGLDAIVYAPHFTRWPEIRERAASHSDDDLTVVPGREVFTGDWRRRRHVLALDLTAPIPDFVTLEGAMAELDRQDAVVLVPHPDYLSFSLSTTEIRRSRDLIDAVEVDNAKFLPWHRRRAIGVARSVDRPVFGSSYAHLRRSVGEIWTAFDAPVDDPADLHVALREGVNRRVRHRNGPAHGLARALEIAHVGWENTWQKFDRVVRRGTEPTHPGHPAYEGRFDDVRVDLRE